MHASGFDSEKILAEAITIATIAAPPFGEEARATAIASILGGLPAWTVRRDEVGNVVAAESWPPPAGSTWILIHVDTVFAAETPLEFERRGNVIRGPGIGDNAIALAAALELARQYDPRTGGNGVVLAFTVGEEALGNLRGASHLLQHGGASTAAAVIAVEGHRGDELGTEMVASARFKLTIEGPGGHSWWDRGTTSAIHELVAFAHRLVALSAESCPGVAVNVGTIEGGSGITAIAAFAEASFEGRSLEMDALDAFIRTAERIRDEIPLPNTLAELGQRPGGVLDANHALVLRAQQARERVGLSRAPTGSSSSDANPFIAAGIPALTLGITTGRNAHQLNEEIDIAPIGRGAAVLATLVDLLRIA